MGREILRSGGREGREVGGEREGLVQWRCERASVFGGGEEGVMGWFTRQLSEFDRGAEARKNVTAVR